MIQASASAMIAGGSEMSGSLVVNNRQVEIPRWCKVTPQLQKIVSTEYLKTTDIAFQYFVHYGKHLFTFQ